MTAENERGPAATGTSPHSQVPPMYADRTVAVGEPRFARRRPEPMPSLPSERMALVEHLVDNPPAVERFAQLAWHVLLVLVRHSDFNGWCFLKVETIAAKAGVSTRSAREALAALTDARLVERQAYLRPGMGGQGANTWRLAPTLVAVMQAARNMAGAMPPTDGAAGGMAQAAPGAMPQADERNSSGRASPDVFLPPELVSERQEPEQDPALSEERACDASAPRRPAVTTEELDNLSATERVRLLTETFSTDQESTTEALRTLEAHAGDDAWLRERDAALRAALVGTSAERSLRFAELVLDEPVRRQNASSRESTTRA